MIKSLCVVFFVYILGGSCYNVTEKTTSAFVLSLNKTNDSEHSSKPTDGARGTTVGAVTLSSKPSVKKELSSSPSVSESVKSPVLVATEGGLLSVKPSTSGNVTTNVSLPVEIGSSFKPSPSTSFRTGEGRGKINARKGAPDFNDTSPEPVSAKNISTVSVSPHTINASSSSSPSRTVSSTTTSTTTQIPTTKKKKKKPLFTISHGDADDPPSESGKSFIESPTTGRDYVFPIVLAILAVPALIYLGKFIYRRGTEFTERQQYHRMYLIDGMYNAR